MGREKTTLTRKKFEIWVETRKEIEKRVFEVAKVYLRFTGIDYFFLKFDWDRIDLIHSIRVIANDESHNYQGEVEVPVDIITKDDFIERAKKWCTDEKKKQDRRRKISRIIHLEQLLKEYPKETQLLLENKKHQISYD